MEVFNMDLYTTEVTLQFDGQEVTTKALLAACFVLLKIMRAQRGKKSQPFWASRLMRKWLNIKPKLYDFSEDEFDMERKDNDDSVCADDSFFEVHGDKCQISKLSAKI
ncbi:hypothetical protein ACP70R_023530 [Stipagrostis hirtigluma subsp. patula]